MEVPNVQRQLVSLGDVLASEEARRAHHPLEVALGRDIAGRAVMVNLADMPHVLISGATGEGTGELCEAVMTFLEEQARSARERASSPEDAGVAPPGAA